MEEGREPLLPSRSLFEPPVGYEEAPRTMSLSWTYIHCSLAFGVRSLSDATHRLELTAPGSLE